MTGMNISINFKTPFLKRNEYFSIMKNINENLKSLSDQMGKIESAQIKLFDTMEDNVHNNKAVLISIKFEKESLIEYRVAAGWNEVIEDIFHSLITKEIIKNLDLHLVY